ncbi:MAG TPA: hypothetical protein ENJ13_09420, partial [Chromatiales bacterium]|nr:hypothetical protein [Chromatiales bacterium]
MYDITAVDSSGNSSAVSGIAFTGEDVNEDILGISLQPNIITISNQLEVVALVPTVNYQFRGLTPRPGARQGFTYLSSDPAIVQVDDAGLVTPIQETNGADIFITVSFAGQPDITIPVEINYSKVLDHLEFVNAGTATFNLPSLNRYHTIPLVNGVFTDGSKLELNQAITVNYAVNPALASVLNIKTTGEALAKAVISEATPALLTASLANNSAISGTLQLTSTDAIPDIELILPATVALESQLKMAVNVHDDVAVRDVRYYLDNALLAVKTAPPYDIVLPIGEDMEGAVLNIRAEAYDVAGQVNSTTVVQVAVIAPSVPVMPDLTRIEPIDLQQVIEGTEVRFVLERPIDINNYKREIRYMSFAFDGQEVGVVYGPTIDSRSVPGEEGPAYFEQWRFTAIAPDISVRESSIVATYTANGENGAKKAFDAIVIKILENRKPQISFVQPVIGQTASVGESLQVQLLVADDTLAKGTRIQLFANNIEVDNYNYINTDDEFLDAFSFQSTRRDIRIPVVEEMLSKQLELYAIATDLHGQETRTPTLKIDVNPDKAPQIALTQPQEGQQFIFGLPFELRTDVVDDVGVDKVEFFVNDRFIGADTTPLYTYVHETEKGITLQQNYTAFAIATDTAGHTTKSQVVNFTLGQDEDAPVVNIVSPVITGTEGGEEIAKVIENSTVVLKIAGYDNVSVERLELRGVALSGSDYVLTGNLDNLLTGADFSPQLIPGGLSAFSALKLMKVPVYSNTQGSTFDSYPVQITAIDGTGNKSTANITVAVVDDQAPAVIEARLKKNQYLPRDIIELDVQTRDDLGVTGIQVSYHLDGSSTPFATQSTDVNSGLIPAENVQEKFTLNLSDFGISNTNHTITLHINATDSLGQNSLIDGGQDFQVNIDVLADNEPPIAAILSPVLNTRLYHEDNVTFQWRTIDDSNQNTIRFIVAGSEIYSQPLSTEEESGQFTYTIPAAGDTLTVSIEVADEFNNSVISDWNYNLVADIPPSISIRLPAAGTRFVEGEAFTMSALVTDDRNVDSAEFFVEENGIQTFSRAFSTEEVHDATANARYLTAAMRTPHRQAAGSITRVGVRATDDNGLQTVEYLDVIIQNDIEPPTLTMLSPTDSFKTTPGTRVKIKGAGTDNLFVTNIVPILIDSNGNETTLDWEVFSKTDHVEVNTAPNPQSFGELVVGEKFFTDFEGDFILPTSYFNNIGETFNLILRGSDFGINSVDTAVVKITIQGDEQSPKIVINNLADTLVDRQTVSPEIIITDNIQLKDYSIYLVDATSTLIEEQINLTSNSEETSFLLDLSPYAPVPAEGKSIIINVIAHDTAGNETNISQQVLIKPDQPPVVSVIDVERALGPVSGGLAIFTLAVQDDYVDDQYPVNFFPIYTSLRGMSAIGGRDPTGLVITSGAVQGKRLGPVVSNNYKPAIRFDYAEANTLTSSLQIADINGIGDKLFETANNKFTIYSNKNINFSAGNYLRFDTGAGKSIRYRLKSYSNTACTALITETLVTDPLGVPMESLVEPGTVAVIITPEVVDMATSSIVDTYLNAIRVDVTTLKNVTSYTFNETETHRITPEIQLSYLLDENLPDGSRANAFLSPREYDSYHDAVSRISAQTFPTPVNADFKRVSVLAYAVDSLSHERSDIALDSLLVKNLLGDQVQPSLTVVEPAAGISLRPKSRILLKLDVEDDTELARTIQLFENGTLIQETAGTYRQPESEISDGVFNNYEISYEVPANYAGTEVDLQLVVSDPNNYTRTETLTFPVVPNELPQLTLNRFSSYKINSIYNKVIDDPEQLNYAEFFVRVGESFKLDTIIDDDVALANYRIYRLNESGQRITPPEFERNYANSCPVEQIRHNEVSAEITFNQIAPTQYDIVLADTVGNEVSRTILVHPLTNMVPGIRITAPVDQQLIAAGTFRIKVGIVATDDRALDESMIEVFANGKKLAKLDASVIGSDDAIGGAGVISQAFNSIYDDIEQNYTIELANDFGREDSPYAIKKGFFMEIPAGLIKLGEPVAISAIIRDSDNAVARHDIEILVAADVIIPEVVISNPEPGFGPQEFSDFTVKYSAFDNVKVSKVEVYQAYGVRTSGNEYLREDFTAPLRVDDAIASRDFEPVTTVNIDTPEFAQLINVDRLQDLYIRFPEIVSPTGTELFDVWIKVVAFDASGNRREREVSFPIRVDERPEVDIVTPINGQKIVESAPLTVNVKTFDDVGISSLRLTATNNGTEIFNVRLQQPPYSFQVAIPAYDTNVPANNTIELRIEAIDTYGAAFNDLDKHSATEAINLEIIQDQQPVISIGNPVNNSNVIEGSQLLVQVNAVDDVGIDKVILNVKGLINGDLILADTSYPFEYLIPVPYGQSGQDIKLSANATEIRPVGGARTVATATETTVIVDKDIDAPEIVINSPSNTGSTVVEKRGLQYITEITDNVAVSAANVILLADKNNDGNFTADEEVYQRILTTPPYSGTVPVDTVQTYMGNLYDANITQLSLQLKVSANDGAGNTTALTRNVTLLRNAKPQVSAIQVLDNLGYNMGSITEVTEGRSIVINVVADDPEAGIDSASLYQALGPAANLGEYTAIGEDPTSPFQFHLTVPVNHVGETLSFQAEALDVDGYRSDRSFTLNLAILEDQPPTAEIIKPDNDTSAIIEGQDIEVFVKAIDDLGRGGIEKVVFYVNDIPSITVFDNYTSIAGGVAQENIYRALISAPQGVDGFVIQAEAFDVLGHSTRTQVVRVGKVEDTVKPELNSLSPYDGAIMTENRVVRLVAQVTDIGVESERTVTAQIIRESQDAAGNWVVLAPENMDEIQLIRDDQHPVGDTTPVSDPDNFHYIYWADFVNGDVLTRTNALNERIRIVTTVTTKNHISSTETTHEIGRGISERRYLYPADPNTYEKGRSALQAIADNVYYSAVDQFKDSARTGAMIAAWTRLDPMRQEQGLGNAGLEESAVNSGSVDSWTGLFILDDSSEQLEQDGNRYVYHDFAGSAELFKGSINEIHADSNLVLASKTGVLLSIGRTCLSSSGSGCGFVNLVRDDIGQDTDTGNIFDQNTSGELLLFTVQNTQGGLGIPYSLAGRIDLPFPDVYGLDRKDDLAFVANGNGGVQVLDISNFAAPYHLGFIKPNGFARDVKIKDGFAYIAASHEGLVIADILNPAMPIVATFDTLGVANRITIEGNTLYATDMAGEGQYSQLNIIDISDPYNPVLKRTVDLYPQRADLVADGSYDVHVKGGKAYVSVLYSDQEDRPAQSVIEIIDLNRLDDFDNDITKPVLIHENASDIDFAARGMVIARGGVQVAAGHLGIDRIELTELSVLDHTPSRDQENIPTDLQTINIELSNNLDENTPLGDFVQILSGDATIGENVSNQFTVTFGTRVNALGNNELATRFINITRADTFVFEQNKKYFIILKQGLTPLTGLELNSDYVFSFTTSPAGNAQAPNIESVTPSTGGIEGGTQITIRGVNFGANPEVYIGGQPHVIEKVLAGDINDPFDKISITTLPNFAGPAAIKVINDAQLSDTVVGAFVYVDQLHISFINPAVVSINQSGENDRVEIVGFGFHDDIKVTAYPHAQPENAEVFAVDNDRLRLYSSEKMDWVVADFGGSYRGFVDVEISDNNGRREVIENALFYGRLGKNRIIEAEEPLTKKNIDDLLNTDSDVAYIADPSKLPPGDIVDIASDSNLGLIYVLGKGVLAKSFLSTGVGAKGTVTSFDPDIGLKAILENTITVEAISPGGVTSNENMRKYFAPGWISLVSYSRDNLNLAAPQHGLGYFNLPQDLVPSHMHLTESHLYVTADGYNFPMINTEYEGRSVLLVYDREDRQPGSNSDAVKDRDILYAMDLPFNQQITHMASSDNLLFVSNRTEGIAVVSTIDPLKPSLIKVIDSAVIANTKSKLIVSDIHIVGNYLYVSHVTDSTVQLVFDISTPTLAQVGELRDAGLSGKNSSMAGVSANTMAIAHSDSDVLLRDISNNSNMFTVSEYDGRGFEVPGKTQDIHANSALVSTVKKETLPKKSFSGGRFYSAFVSFFDTSDRNQVSLLDAMTLYKEVLDLEILSSIQTDDGIAVVASKHSFGKSELVLIDSFIIDLASSYPSVGQTGVIPNVPLTLTLTSPLNIPVGENEQAYLARYLALILDDGSEAGISIGFTASLSVDGRVISITPDVSLLLSSNYRLELHGEPASRRTQGLFDYTIPFSTASDNHLAPIITAVLNNVISTEGGEFELEINNPQNPVILVAGLNATIMNTLVVDADTSRYTVLAPENFAGPAQLEVINANGSRTQSKGAVLYVEPLVLESILPAQGSINGGTTVIIKGRGFRPGLNRIKVSFDEIPADTASIRVLDSETIELVTPRGRLGLADITVTLDNGQIETLPQAFDYQQPVQSSIDDDARIYDMALDSTGTFLVTANGIDGIALYNIDSSTFTANPANPLNPDALRKQIDFNGDGADDRLLVKVELPEGYAALGVDTFFERGYDRVFVTASNGTDSRLFIVNFDSSDVTNASIISELPLFSNLARGVEVDNNRALIAMGDKGLGIVDSYLHTRIYLSNNLQLPNGVNALDVTQLTSAPGTAESYAVVAGEFDIDNNRLLDSLVPGSGGFFIIENNDTNGLMIRGQLDIAASRVVTNGDYAYLAAGEGGLVIVDIKDLSNPRIVSRVTSPGFVSDVDINGNIAYLALGEAGVLTVDVTDPSNPVVTEGMEALGDFRVDVVLADDFSAITGGIGDSIIQVTPDVVLKIHEVDPQSRILDQDALLNNRIIVRFNKAIDLWPENILRFKLYNEAGVALPVNVEILNNDAIIDLADNHGLVIGDKLKLVVQSGVESLKPISDTVNIRLYKLLQDQVYNFTYRGQRPDALTLSSVVPRRVQQNKLSQITVSGLGIPTDAERVELYIGSIASTIIDITSNDNAARTAIITAELPAMAQAGQYDVTVRVNRSGVWESAVLYGGLLIDAPIHFDSLTPQWGPMNGGTTVTILGQGFEPGNSVLNALKVRIGSLPVRSVRVFSTKHIEVITGGGPSGRRNVLGEDRYGNQTSLSGDDGFGYGLKLISSNTSATVFSSDVLVDQATGVALTNGGYLFENIEIAIEVTDKGVAPVLKRGVLRDFAGSPLPDTVVTASFDVQNTSQPLIVGAGTSLPKGQQAEEQISRFLLQASLSARNILDLGEGLSSEEQQLLEELRGSEMVLTYDSIRIQKEEVGVGQNINKKLYVASGNGGIATVNLDDLNGLQIENIVLDGSADRITDIDKWDDMLYALSAPATGKKPNTSCGKGVDKANSGTVIGMNYFAAGDPVRIGVIAGVNGATTIMHDNEWLYASGFRKAYAWNAAELCALFTPDNTAARPESSASPSAEVVDTISAVNIFDPVVTRDFSFTSYVLDHVAYGDYMIVALGGSGLEIFNRERPEQRTVFNFTGLMPITGDSVRLHMMGSTLFVSAANAGVVILDMRDPINPYVLSAGNDEHIDAVDIYKDRLVAATGKPAISLLQLPQSLVVASNIGEGETIARNETIDIRFNENMTTAS